MDYDKAQLEQNLRDCAEHRAEVVKSLQTLVENTKDPDEFKYYENINDLRNIVDELDEVRETELDNLIALNKCNGEHAEEVDKIIERIYL